VRALVGYLENRIQCTEGIAKYVLMMDLAAVDYLWEAWARDKECGKLRGDQLDWEAGVALPDGVKPFRQSLVLVSN
jgi:hypothetical protein